MTVIAIPKILQEKLTAEGAEALVEIINKADERAKDNIIELVEERFEKRLAQVESRIIKWMFIFIFGQYWLIVGTITGIMFAFFRK